VKGEWIAAHEHIIRTCYRNMVVTAEVVTEKTVIEKQARIGADGKEAIEDVPVTTTSTRRERKMSVSVARLLSDVHDKMAKMAGYNVGDPAGADPPPPRKKMHVHRDGEDEQTEPRPN
jgi:hypothetical protein